MSQQVFDIDTVGYGYDLGEYFDFHINNTFYMNAPTYYKSFYSLYLTRCLAVYDGWVGGWHNAKSGLVPQKMLPSITNGLANMVFANGIDFMCDDSKAYFNVVRWAKQCKLYASFKKGYKFAIAGGSSLLKINRDVNKEFYVSAHRIDTFFADLNAKGEIINVKVFYDMIHNTNSTDGMTKHFAICEERYFKENQPTIRQAIYDAGGSLQTSVSARPDTPIDNMMPINWENLPSEVKRQVKKLYPSIRIGEEEALPFKDNLGCFLMKFTEDIPQCPDMPFGQPIGDILFTENFQYDQMKYFEKNEVDLARARALVPEQYWNKDDPAQDRRAMSDRFYQKVSSNGDDTDKITPIQFMLRGNDIKTVKENIYKDCAFKLGLSASSIASFLNEGAGARTATEIISERTKTDTWINGQINLNAPIINELLAVLARLNGWGYVEIILKTENQAPQIEVMKAYGDQLAAGHMTPELFVKNSYKNLTLAEQQREVNFIKAYMEYQLGLAEQESAEAEVEIEKPNGEEKEKPTDKKEKVVAKKEDTDENPKGE